MEIGGEGLAEYHGEEDALAISIIARKTGGVQHRTKSRIGRGKRRRNLQLHRTPDSNNNHDSHARRPRHKRPLPQLPARRAVNETPITDTPGNLHGNGKGRPVRRVGPHGG